LPLVTAHLKDIFLTKGLSNNVGFYWPREKGEFAGRKSIPDKSLWKFFLNGNDRMSFPPGERGEPGLEPGGE